MATRILEFYYAARRRRAIGEANCIEYASVQTGASRQAPAGSSMQAAKRK